VDRTVRRSPGFSLVELFFAITVLAVGFLGVLGMFTSSFKLVNHSRSVISATNVAYSYLEKVKFADFSSVNSSPPTTVTVSNRVNDVRVNTSFLRTVTVTYVTATTKRVLVDVTWPESSFNDKTGANWKKISFETYISSSQ